MTVTVAAHSAPKSGGVMTPSQTQAFLASVPINPDADYTIPQILTWASMSTATFYRIAKAGRGPTIRKRGRRSFVRGSDFLTWRDTVQ